MGSLAGSIRLGSEKRAKVVDPSWKLTKYALKGKLAPFPGLLSSCLPASTASRTTRMMLGNCKSRQ